MAALGFVAAYTALIALSLWRSRSVTAVMLGLGVIAVLLGSAVQTAIALGVPMSLLGLQLLLLVALAGLLAFAWTSHRPAGAADARVAGRRWWLIVVPLAVIAVILVVLRGIAWANGGPMTGMPFLDAQTNTADVAHWLNITGQFTTGQDLWLPEATFAGPMLVLLTASTTLAAAVSQLTLGGANEVAVAINGVIMASMMLIAASPLALAPLIERRLRGRRAFALATGVLFGMVILAIQSTTTIEASNLGMQFALWALTLWAASFFVFAPTSPARTASTVIALGATTAWPSLAPFGFVLLAVLIVTGIGALRQRRLPVIETATLIATLLLIPFALIQSWNALASGVLESAAATLRYMPDLVWLLLVAVASAIATSLVLSRPAGRSPSAMLRMAPLGALAAYAITLVVVTPMLTRSTLVSSAADVMAVTAIVTIAATAGIALLALPDRTLTRRAPMVAVAALAFAITIGGITPGSALAHITGVHADDASNLSWYRAAEVQSTSTQPISSMPIGCVFLPAAATMPTGQPDPALTYRCTRLLVALHGLSGRSDSILDWMGSELGAGGLWGAWHSHLIGTRESIASKSFLLLDDHSNVIGYESLSSLVTRFPPTN